MRSIIKLRLLRLKEDAMVFVLMTAMALGFTAIFGFSFNSYKPSVMIVDEDNSYYSEYLINELRRDQGFNFESSDLRAAAEAIEEGSASMALVINQGFSGNIEKGGDISLGIMKLKDDTIILTVQELASSIALKMASGVRISDITAEFIKKINPEADMQDIKASAYDSVMDSWRYKNPITVTSVTAETGAGFGYDNLIHSMIGFTIFFSMYTMVFSIGTILSDKQHKTWERMLVSPVSEASILGGTMAVSYMTGAVQMGVLILLGKYLLKINWGNSMPGIMMVSSAFVFTVTSLGLMLSGFIKTQGQLGTLAPIVLTSTSMLGGCMWPLEIVNNKAMLFLAELTPQKWAMQGIESIANGGMGFEAAVLPSIVLICMGIIYFIIGVRALKQ